MACQACLKASAGEKGIWKGATVPGRVYTLGLLLACLGGCASQGERQRSAEADRTRPATYLRSARPESVADLHPLPQTAGLPDYLTYAALNNPGLEAAFHRWKAALERAPQARALPDPRFTYRHYIEAVETRVGPQRHGFGLAQTFPWLGKLNLRSDMALTGADAAQQRYQAEKLRLFYRVKHAYFEYYYVARVVAVVHKQHSLVRYLEQVARARYRVAAGGHPDVIRAQVELGKLDDRVRTAEALRGPLVARLNAAMNRPVHAPLPWPRSASQEDIAATDEQILDWLRKVNPEIRALAHAAAREKQRVELARMDTIPDVTLGVDLIDTDEMHTRTVRDNGKDPVMATVSVNLPIWLAKYQAHEREARARHLAALRAKADRANTLSADAKLVLYRFRDAQRKINLYRDTLMPKANQSLRAVQQAFRTGKASFLDVIDSQRVLLEFELSYERALADQAQRLAELEMLVGKPLPRRPNTSAAEAAATQPKTED